MARTTSSVSREEVSAAAAKLQPLGTVTDTTMFGVSGQASTTSRQVLDDRRRGDLRSRPGVGYAAKVVDQNGTPKIDGFTFTVNGVTASGGHPPDRAE